MNKPSWTTPIIVRYTLLQLPGIALLVIALLIAGRWLNLPVWLSGGLVIFWIVKDIVLFPFVWRAYDWEGTTAEHSMVGRRGVVIDRLSPLGYVQVRNERWRAEVISGAPLDEGTVVRVQEVRGLTLVVELDDYKK